jgi:ketosteroid isomerase-like protein
MDAWHLAATNADFKAYFAPTTDDFIFLGTAPGERWTKNEFQAFSKPYFDKGKAWDFKSLQRSIYLSKDQKTAWFDELLDTQMKICRGSGVLIKKLGKWKIAHYVLSMTIPNDKTTEVVKIKDQIETAEILKLKNAK